MIESLAPAGNEKSFFAAINNGADAVYLGLSDFSARKNAENFTTENIGYYIAYAHLFNAKVYVAVNTLIKDSEIESFFSTVKAAYLAGADAFIVQDVFLAGELKGRFPDIVLHLSTQGGVNNTEGAKFAVSRGFSRVILARETGIEEIKKIADVVETEVFVHGALCSSFSGHCYFSSFVGGNSGNRGFCKQPCRKKYEIESKTGCGEYSISLSDLNLADDINQLKAAGVSSVKIEGRMRTPEYVASAVKLYRAAIDGQNYSFDEIKREYNRGNYTKGYIYGVDKNIISDKVQSHLGEKVGTVANVIDKGKCKIVSREKFVEGDGFKILRNGYEVGNAVATKTDGILSFNGNVKAKDEVFITKDLNLNLRLNSIKRLKPIKVAVRAVAGEKLSLTAENITVFSDNVLEKAKTSILTEKDILDNLYKTDKYPYSVSAEIFLFGEPFVAKSQLNKLRAELYGKIFFGNIQPKRLADYSKKNVKSYRSAYDNIIISDKISNVANGDALVYFPTDYDRVSKDEVNGNDKIYLYVPSYLESNEIDKIIELSQYFYGFYVDGLDGLHLARTLSKPFIAGLGLNAFNSTDVSELYKLGADAVAFSKELSMREISQIGCDGNVFTSGSIRLTEFIYCPFGKKCADCKRGYKFKVHDESGHDFTLRRYKICGKCRFELYNGALLYCGSQYKKLTNLLLLDVNCKEKLLNDDPTIKILVNTTTGNLKRGVN